MPAVGGPFLCACAILAFAGIAKIARPDATRRAARELGLPFARTAVRGFGAVELSAAVTGAFAGRAAAYAVAAVYAALAAVAFRLTRRAAAAPCGCFGDAGGPASMAHVVFDLAATGCAVLAAQHGSVVQALARRPLGAFALVTFVGCAARLAVLALTTFPLDRSSA